MRQAETTYHAIIGRILADKRKALAIDQAEMAEKIGVTRPTLSRIENGDAVLTASQLAGAAEVFGKTPGEILSEADRIKAHAEKLGFKVHMSRPAKSTSKVGLGLALLGAGALAGLIGTALAQDSEDKESSKKEEH